MVGRYQATLENKETRVVVFDLETSGLGPNCDVLQIAARSDVTVFNEYIDPTRTVDPGAAAVNGLSNVGGRLHLRGEPLRTSPLRAVLLRFLEFLQNFGKPCTLVAHNCFGFDAPRLLNVVRACDLEREFGDIVLNFVDTMPLFQRIFPDRVGGGQMKLENLASQLLSLQTDDCHNALGDTYLLETLVHHYFSYEHLVAEPLGKMAWNWGDSALVFFDLETSGLSPNCDVLQIAAKSGDYAFNRYIRPSKPIDPRATQLNGLTNFDGRLRLHGQPLPTSSLHRALCALLDFLQGFGRPCTLVAHNCFGFDAPRLVRAIRICRLEAAFESVVWAFADSLVLFRNLFPSRTGQGQLTLVGLANELLGVNANNASHEAFYDTQLLEDMVCRYFDHNTIVSGARGFASFLR